MSRTRIVLAAASVMLGIAGALIVLRAADSDGERARASAVVAAPPPIAVVLSGSRCVIDSHAGVVAFEILLHNAAREDQATRLHPWVGFRDGGEISVTSFDKTASLLATEKRKYEIDVPYEPGKRPNRCQVSLANGARASIAIRQAS